MHAAIYAWPWRQAEPGIEILALPGHYRHIRLESLDRICAARG